MTFNFKQVVAALTLIVVSIGATAGPVYMRSTVGQPWGVNTNEDAMDAAFGAGNWQDLRYETANTGDLFANADYIFMEGGDTNANELETFLGANAAAINTYVLNGGALFINSAPNEGNGMNMGFGVSLTYNGGPYCGNNCEAVDPLHPIFNGVATSFGGGFFSHAVVGAGVTGLIKDASTGDFIAAEKFVGNGYVMFGGMTTTNFHNPQPDAFNLRVNMLQYGAAQANVPEPETIMLMLMGLVSLVIGRRRQTA